MYPEGKEDDSSLPNLVGLVGHASRDGRRRTFVTLKTLL
jgi:hypothetical protein